MLKHFSQKICKIFKQLSQNESKFPAKVRSSKKSLLKKLAQLTQKAQPKKSSFAQKSSPKKLLKSLLQELHYILLAGVCLRHRVRATLG